MEELNKLITKMLFVKDYVEINGRDPLLEESLIEFSEVLKEKYGDYLVDRLFDVYDDFFEDDELKHLEDYIYGEVEVFSEDFDNKDMLISIKTSPLRIEVNDTLHTFNQVMWQVA